MTAEGGAGACATLMGAVIPACRFAHAGYGARTQPERGGRMSASVIRRFGQAVGVVVYACGEPAANGREVRYDFGRAVTEMAAVGLSGLRQEIESTPLFLRGPRSAPFCRSLHVRPLQKFNAAASTP